MRPRRDRRISPCRLRLIGTPRREVSQNGNTLRLGATNPKLHRNAIDPSFIVRTMRTHVTGNKEQVKP